MVWEHDFLVCESDRNIQLDLEEGRPPSPDSIPDQHRINSIDEVSAGSPSGSADEPRELVFTEDHVMVKISREKVDDWKL